MTSKRKLAARTGVIALTATLSLTAATAAYAGTDQRITVAGGQVSFTHQGDYIDAYDLKKDGYCLTAELKVNKFHHWSTTACGYNTYKYKSLKRINEGTKVYLRACYTKKHSNGSYTRVKCSGWQSART
ncbi:hypothetical protein ADK76_08670 [Streptomyces griseoflavus]|uniref:hypothetical protein n=1 Tax=Streptomyces TaxID=1883 RepID=UPI0004C9021A|nr:MULTISPECIES: hypothetical protein [Streptomyces]KOG64608.1 hypothetical protein ADK76_08670 [Streptomyces griseoflavus]KOT87406.1 hypothetical protein ADK86_36005 [Streptomyces sp. NRRL F-5755]